MDLEPIKRAIAKVIVDGGESVIGTAFFIGEQYAITALHVVADTETTPLVFSKAILLKFLDGHETAATVVSGFYDVTNDWAVLQCVHPPSAPPIARGTGPSTDAILRRRGRKRHKVPPIARGTGPSTDDEWKSFGYPEIQPQGMTIAGKVRDPAAPDGAIELWCVEGGTGARLHGLSGAPCLVNNAAVGILRSTLVEEVIDGHKARKLYTQAGTVYACSSKAIVDFQIRKGVALLPASWSPPEIVKKDFLVFLSSSEGKYNKKLGAVAKTAQEKLTRLISEPHCVPAISAFESRDAFLDTVSALCRAKVVVLDATHFEPTVMLLAGIRAVVRRGVTILSVGHDYALGDRLKIPFNITDANLVAHSQTQADRGPDPVDLLASRIQRGLTESQSSIYLDTPVYDAIRKLPADRRGVIPKEEGVLVLCPFNDTYNTEVWEKRLRRGLRHQLGRLGANPAAKPDLLGVSRSFELNSPRLVTQALYEYIRRAQSCVADLTDWSPNVMFEFGVRLAATGEGTSCLLAKNWEANVEGGLRDQCARIVALFVDPQGLYDPSKEWEEEKAYGNAYGPQAVLPFRGLANGAVHQTIGTALDIDSEPASRSVYRELIDSSELFGKAPGNSKPVGLYPGNSALTGREEDAEFDRLMTAWFHVFHRHSPAEWEEKADLREAAARISETLLERHADRINELRRNAREELIKILDSLITVFSNSRHGG